jgi:CLIP-associating protein 1/2
LFIKSRAAEGDVTEKPVDPIKIYSDKELVREIEKIASILVPEKDWSVRIAAMQRIEGLVLGGWCFEIPFQFRIVY